MSFTRTNSGVSNLHLFYDTGIVIYTEGGDKTFSVDDVDNGKYNSNSVDIKFWKDVLKACRFKKQVEFRAIGSKTASTLICEKIVKGEVKNIAVARDRDLDQYLGEIIDSPFILYTKGYSWENDVFTKDLTLSQIESMIFESEIKEEILAIIEAAYDDFKIYGKHLLKLELIFRKEGVSFISDLKGERFFKIKKFPSIDRKQVKGILRIKKEAVKRPVTMQFNITNMCPFLNNYGKLIEALSIAIISYVCKKYDNYKLIPKQMIEASMIDKFARKIKDEGDAYYFDIVERLGIAQANKIAPAFDNKS